MTGETELFRQVMLNDLASFAQRSIHEMMPGLALQWNWHLDLICYNLTLLADGKINRLLICLPPRSLKSMLCSVIYPAWLLARNEAEQILCVSYGQALADDFGRQTRQLMETPFYTARFGTRLSQDRRAAEQFETTAGGSRIATSRQATITGRGGNFVILDEIMKPDEAQSETMRACVMDWLRGTLVSRANNKADVRMLLGMQRLHEEDPVGHMLVQGGWEPVILPALAIDDEEHHYQVAGRACVKRRQAGEPLHPERESSETLDEVRRDMGSVAFEAQCQQNPLPAAGHIIKRDWFDYYDQLDTPAMQRTIQSIDTGIKTGASHDYSAIITLGERDGKIFVLDVWRGRLEMPELCRKVIELRDRYRPERVIIEDKGSGTSLMQALRAQWFYEFLPSLPRGSKEERLNAIAPAIENGSVYLPRMAPWLDTFLHEVCGFPAAKHDDQVDALSQGISWFQGQGCLGGLFEYMRQEVECKRAHEEDRTVPMRVMGICSHLLLSGRSQILIPTDRIIYVAEADVGDFIRLGCVRLDAAA
jgi:predicted phage terminase large subunit-like protein